MSNAESSSMPSSSEDGQDGKGSSKQVVWIPHTEHGWELVTLIGSKNSW